MIFVIIIALMALLTVAVPATGLAVSLVWLRTGPSARRVTVAMSVFCGSTLLGIFLTAVAAFVVFNATLDCMDGCSYGA